MAEPHPTKQRLAQDLEAAGAPACMVQQALAGQYDDDESDSATPIADLVRACMATGKPTLRALAEAAKQGKYEGTKPAMTTLSTPDDQRRQVYGDETCTHCGQLEEGHHSDGRCYTTQELVHRLRFHQRTGR